MAGCSLYGILHNFALIGLHLASGKLNRHVPHAKQKLSLGTPYPEVPVQASESADVGDRQLQGLPLLDIAKILSAIVNSLSCGACKTDADGKGELGQSPKPGYRSVHLMHTVYNEVFIEQPLQFSGQNTE